MHDIEQETWKVLKREIPFMAQMSRGRKGRRTKEMVNIAGQRIQILLEAAEEEAKAHKLERSDRYVELARKIGMRYNVRIPRHYKRRFCRHCHAYLQPAKNSRVRLRGRTITVHCNNCGRFTRVPYKTR
jgi:ribonuclease P protein subunit RPR2